MNDAALPNSWWANRFSFGPSSPRLRALLRGLRSGLLTPPALRRHNGRAPLALRCPDRVHAHHPRRRRGSTSQIFPGGYLRLVCRRRRGNPSHPLRQAMRLLSSERDDSRGRNSKASSSEEPSGEGDRRPSKDLVSQVGVAAQTVRRAADLQRSREQLVSAREEERRRLRQELLDDFGSRLAAGVMQLQMAQELVRTDPAAAENLMGKLGADAKSVIEDIRRLVDGLGPCALDQLGLVPAITQRVSCIASLRSGTGNAGTLKVAVEATGHLEGLPAAIEVAAYHIVSEAVSAACRHASATNCEVRLRRGESSLAIEVIDDGCGLREEVRPEAAMSCMRDRAGELGGTLSVASTPGGTVVRAHLPFPEM